MSVKAILILCAQALLAKSALSQFAGSCGLAAPGLAYDGLGYGAGFAGRGLGYNGFGAGYAGNAFGYDGVYAPAMEFTATSGGALPVSSVSAMAPVGISVASDNFYEGALAVGGELPFVGTVAMEGVVPTAGAGAVNHACGNGRNAMISENAAYGTAGYGGAAFGAAGAFGYGAGLGDFAYPAAGLGGAVAPAGLGYRGGCGGNFGYAF